MIIDRYEKDKILIDLKLKFENDFKISGLIVLNCTFRAKKKKKRALTAFLFRNYLYSIIDIFQILLGMTFGLIY